MIPVEEAKKIILDNVSALSPVTLALDKALGHTLAEDVYAAIDIPAFDQSSMDGYAFRFEDYQSNTPLLIEGEMAAGNDTELIIQPQQAVRIFTGAAVPQGANTVVMQEKTLIENKHLVIHDDEITQGLNVRPKGSEIAAGTLALAKGTTLTPAAIGFLAGMGTTEVKIYPKPVVYIIITGNELQQPGKGLAYGQVYESNSYTLRAVLQQLHIADPKISIVEDNVQKLRATFEQLLQDADMILLTGGVSVGDYDYVIRTLSLCGVTQLFHKIKQRPGKPLYFGKRNSTLVFGLPGNPSSVLTCFYEYVMQALEQMSMLQKIIETTYMPLATNYKKNAGLTHFLKARIVEDKVVPLGAQESYRMSSFAVANCFIRLEEERTSYDAGEQVEVHIIP